MPGLGFLNYKRKVMNNVLNRTPIFLPVEILIDFLFLSFFFSFLRQSFALVAQAGVQSAMAQSRLTATFASWVQVQAIFLPQPPE